MSDTTITSKMSRTAVADLIQHLATALADRHPGGIDVVFEATREWGSKDGSVGLLRIKVEDRPWVIVKAQKEESDGTA